MNIWGIFKNTPPTLTDGQSTDLQLDSAGRLKVAATTTPGTVNADGSQPVQERGAFGRTTVTPADSGAVTGGRWLAVIATVAGNVKVRFTDNSDLTFPVAVGLTLFPFEINRVYLTDTTATATYFVLK